MTCSQDSHPFMLSFISLLRELMIQSITTLRPASRPDGRNVTKNKYWRVHLHLCTGKNIMSMSMSMCMYKIYINSVCVCNICACACVCLFQCVCVSIYIIYVSVYRSHLCIYVRIDVHLYVHTDVCMSKNSVENCMCACTYLIY